MHVCMYIHCDIIMSSRFQSNRYIDIIRVPTSGNSHKVELSKSSKSWGILLAVKESDILFYHSINFTCIFMNVLQLLGLCKKWCYSIERIRVS